MGFVPLDRLPLVILHLHNRCNQKCPYCVADTSPHGGYGPIGDAGTRDAIVRFFAGRGPYQILLNGGEPLITPGILGMLEALVAQGHRIALQSNLRSGAGQFMRAVGPEQTVSIVTAFHSVVLHRLKPYLGVVEEMKARGYPIAVKLVLDEVMLAQLSRVCEAFSDKGIGVLLAPRVYFPKGEQAYPQAYSAAHWCEIAPRITTVSSWLYFAGGWRSRGRPCPAGQRMFHATVGTGAIHGCAHGFPRHLGDLYADTLTPLSKMPACGLDRCICDFHSYVGLTPGVDDSARFGQLLSGPIERVPFRDYLAFVAKAGITPCVDLRPVMAETGAWDGQPAACGALPQTAEIQQ